MSSITRVRSKKTKETYDIEDLNAVKGIYVDDVLLDKKDGYVYIETIKVSKATDRTLGTVYVPTNITETKLNDLKLENNGGLIVDIPIHKIQTPDKLLTPNAEKTISIPKATVSYGLVRQETDNDYCVKLDNGALYVKFSTGITDIVLETENINFENLVAIGELNYDK